MNPPEKFLIAMIVIGYAAVEAMLLQHGGSVSEMAGALLIGAVLVAYVFVRSKRAAAQRDGGCASCASSSCASCASAPAASRGEPR